MDDKPVMGIRTDETDTLNAMVLAQHVGQEFGGIGDGREDQFQQVDLNHLGTGVTAKDLWSLRCKDAIAVDVRPVGFKVSLKCPAGARPVIHRTILVVVGPSRRRNQQL